MDLSNPIRSIVSTLEGQVYRVLARTSEPLTGSRVAQIVESRSNAGVRAALGRLVEEGTVTVRQFGPSLLYAANREHLLWPAIEALVFFTEDVTRTLEAMITDFVTKRLAPLRHAFELSDVTVAFYGSVARGQSTKASDIDLVLLVPSAEDFGEQTTGIVERLVDDLQRSVHTWTGNACSVYVLDPQRLNALIDESDPMIESWQNDSVTFHGPDLRSMLVTRG